MRAVPVGLTSRLVNVLCCAAVVAVAGVVVGGALGPSSPVRATPGSPGVPGEPTVLFQEDFENHDDSGAHPLPEYESADGHTYTADDYWLSTAHCNGFVLSRRDVQRSGYCANRTDEWDKLTAKADALAQLNGTDRATNSVLATNTTPGPDNAVPPPNGVMLETTEGVLAPT